MRILYVSRPDLLTNVGGDTTQVLRTRAEIERAGHVVTLLGEHGPGTDLGSSYDIVHFFNLIRPGDLPHTILEDAAAARTKLVVSPIFVDYTAAEHFHPNLLRRTLARTIPSSTMEFAKAVARRTLRKYQPRNPDYFFVGHKRLVRRVLEHTTVLLPNSRLEGERVLANVGLRKPTFVVPNGFSSDIFNTRGPRDERAAGAILCVGRIEPRKNQLGLVRAMRGSGRKILLVGEASKQNEAYLRQCFEAGQGDVEVLPFQPPQTIASLFRAAALHVLPSYFETTGLVSLEALACGCPIVVSDAGDQPEYFSGVAATCKAQIDDSIRRAVELALARGFQGPSSVRLLSTCTWERAGEVTLAAYAAVGSSDFDLNKAAAHHSTLMTDS